MTIKKLHLQQFTASLACTVITDDLQALPTSSSSHSTLTKKSPNQLISRVILNSTKWTDCWVWDCSACSGLRLLLTISDGTLKLLTHICWHFQVPGPHCETWASCLLDDGSLPLTCYLSNIKSILLIVFFFSLPRGKGFNSAAAIRVSLLHCATWCIVFWEQ